MSYNLSEMVPVIHFFYTGNVTVMSNEEKHLRKILRELGCRLEDLVSIHIPHSTLQGNDSSKDNNHPYQRNQLIRYRKIRDGQSFDLARVKILHPQFLH